MTRLGRVALIAAAAVLVVFLLFTVVFPWVDRQLVADPVMEGSAPAAGEPPSQDG